MTEHLQTPLFHEDIFESIRTVVMAMGGSKKVGGLLWPEKAPAQAGELLNNCLNTTRQEKLDPEQVLFLIVHGQKIGCHSITEFIGNEAGYKLIAIEPEDEKAELQKLVIKASENFGDLVSRLEKLNKRESL